MCNIYLFCEHRFVLLISAGDQTGGLYEFDALTGAIGEDEVSFDESNYVDWTELKSANNVTYNQQTNQVTINSMTLTLPQISFIEWEQFYSASLDLFYIILRNATRASSDGFAWIYFVDLSDTNLDWNRIAVDDVTFGMLVNEEFLSNATYTGTLDKFEGSQIIDEYRLVTLGGYYRYNIDQFMYIGEFCCSKVDERSNRLYLSYDDAISIITFNDDRSGDITNNVTYTYTQDELERDSGSMYNVFCSGLVVVMIFNNV